ncbi:hypothetical protein GCM10023185_23740 [Hymenobacter saemangeumensis]|uniref:Uncharacterized protein n=1 Tax=Hymenobacter saemangeumensis TaxID=1084522 RepID=A0ABP8IG90_9BACT
MLLWAATPLLPTSALAQAAAVTPDSPLPRLLAQRKVLTQRYAEARAQRHSLFGNKPSKKDLQEVVDALQGIVDKDQEIVDVLNRTAKEAQYTSARLAATTTHLEASSRDDRNLTAQRLYEVQNDLNNQKVKASKQLARIRELEAELAEVQDGRQLRDALIAGLGLLCAGLLVAWLRAGRKATARRPAARPAGRA